MPRRYKGVVIILDGLGDRGITQFDGKTPLEAAHTPNMDRLATAGQCGFVDPLLPGLPLSTHTATGLLFGLPVKMAAGLTRGPVEAAGIGIANDPAAVYLRCNFATLEKVDGRYRILDRRAGRINAEKNGLAEALFDLDLGDGISARVYPATQHRGVVKITGPELSPLVSDTDPASQYKTLGVRASRAVGAKPAAIRTAQAVNRLTELAYQRLSAHPVNRSRQQAGLPVANGIICRSAGRLPKLHTQIAHLGLRCAVVAGEKTLLGLAAMLGYTQITSPTFSSLPDTDLADKVVHAQAALREHDLVYLHIKGTDICSHDLDPRGKQALLERIDEALAPLLMEELVIGITGDHSTDSNNGRHTGDPVPSLIRAPQGRIDRCREFSEDACCLGGLGRINSQGYLTSLLDMMNRLENFHPHNAGLYF